MDVPAISQNDRILVPLRFVVEALGAEVDFCLATQVIDIVR